MWRVLLLTSLLSCEETEAQREGVACARPWCYRGAKLPLDSRLSLNRAQSLTLSAVLDCNQKDVEVGPSRFFALNWGGKMPWNHAPHYWVWVPAPSANVKAE